MSKNFRKSDLTVKKILAPPFSSLVGVSSDDFGYKASYDGYNEVGRSQDDAVRALIKTLLAKGYRQV